jgi:hypothetical protein
MDYGLFSHQALDVCLGLEKEDRVWINSWDYTVDLASHLAWECRNRGFETFLTLQLEELWLRSLHEVEIFQLALLYAHWNKASSSTTRTT